MTMTMTNNNNQRDNNNSNRRKDNDTIKEKGGNSHGQGGKSTKKNVNAETNKENLKEFMTTQGCVDQSG
jgi:hypothetical protein